MRFGRLVRWTKAVACGAVMLQFAGCTFQTFNEVLQTLLLGVSATGAIAIIREL